MKFAKNISSYFMTIMEHSRGKEFFKMNPSGGGGGGGGGLNNYSRKHIKPAIIGLSAKHLSNSISLIGQ